MSMENEEIDKCWDDLVLLLRKFNVFIHSHKVEEFLSTYVLNERMSYEKYCDQIKMNAFIFSFRFSGEEDQAQQMYALFTGHQKTNSKVQREISLIDKYYKCQEESFADF